MIIDKPDAIGVGVGLNFGLSVDATYQHEIRQFIDDRIEINVGAFLGKNEHGVKGSIFYQWLFPMSKTWNWYLGIGGTWGIIDYERLNHNYEADLGWDILGTGFGVGEYDRIDTNISGHMIGAIGQVGIEYKFPHKPLQFTMSWQPTLKYAIRIEGYVLHPACFTAALRYRF